MAGISWLHLTDWHVGQTGQKHRWPSFRAAFEQDLKTVVAKSGPIDFVFFTGDFVQSGSKSEFEELEQHLASLWRFFATLQSNPQLIAVPGNHDLQRPSNANPTALALTSWNSNSDVRQAFWAEGKNELRKEVVSWFREYEDWCARTAIPVLKFQQGLLPGDGYVEIQKNGISLGILKLNSTFLQYRSGNLEGHLAIDPAQVPFDSHESCLTHLNQDVRLLLTHHPVSWFDTRSQSSFKSEIAPASRFHLHLCGHLHDARLTSVSEGGSKPRNTYQGTSFFGLEFVGEEQEEHRRHGYVVGNWAKSGDELVQTCWPRRTEKKQSGSWGIAPDYSNDLDEDNSLTLRWRLPNAHAEPPVTPGVLVGLTSSSPSHLVETAPENALSHLPRLKVAHEAQHHAIRSEEVAKFRSIIENSKVVNLVADWGTAKDSFIAVCLELWKPHTKTDVFTLNCDAFSHGSEFESGFKLQFGITLQQFLTVARQLSSPFLIFDGLQPSVTDADSKEVLQRLCSLCTDFAPNLRLILIGRFGVSNWIPEVQIGPLDEPETRAYIEAHPRTRSDILSIDCIERIHFASGGLPVQIDRLLERLQVASLDAVLEEEAALLASKETDASLHKSLVQSVLALEAREHEDDSFRSLKLLRALSVLPYGETLEGVKRFLPRTPFSASDAVALFDMSLLDSMAIYQNLSTYSAGPLQRQSKGPSSMKLLRVPKQVRDCVMRSMSTEDKRTFIYAAAEFIFGQKWRTHNKIKLRRVPDEYRDYVNSGLGNEFAVISSLLNYLVEVNSPQGAKAAARLGLHYAGVLKAADRNRDLKFASRALIHLLDQFGLNEEVAQFHALAGRAFRLTSEENEAVVHFEAAIKYFRGQQGGLKRSDGHMLLELAMCYADLKEKEKATSLLKEAGALAKPHSLLASQVASQLSEIELDENAAHAKLQELETQARKESWTSHANDLAIELSTRQNGAERKIAWLDKVLSSEENGWNQVRAVVTKAEIALESGIPEKISAFDRARLHSGYAYCHAQRHILFDRCHDVLWHLYRAEKRLDYLYSLFTNSSFIWRMRGDEKSEIEYFEDLEKLKSAPDPVQVTGILFELEYFAKRAKVLVLKLIGRAGL